LAIGNNKMNNNNSNNNNNTISYCNSNITNEYPASLFLPFTGKKQLMITKEESTGENSNNNNNNDNNKHW